MNPRFDLATIEKCSLAGIAMDEYYSVGSFLSKKFSLFSSTWDINSPIFGPKPVRI